MLPFGFTQEVLISFEILFGPSRNTLISLWLPLNFKLTSASPAHAFPVPAFPQHRTCRPPPLLAVPQALLPSQPQGSLGASRPSGRRASSWCSCAASPHAAWWCEMSCVGKRPWEVGLPPRPASGSLDAGPQCWHELWSVMGHPDLNPCWYPSVTSACPHHHGPALFSRAASDPSDHPWTRRVRALPLSMPLVFLTHVGQQPKAG